MSRDAVATLSATTFRWMLTRDDAQSAAFKLRFEPIGKSAVRFPYSCTQVSPHSRTFCIPTQFLEADFDYKKNEVAKRRELGRLRSQTSSLVGNNHEI